MGRAAPQAEASWHDIAVVRARDLPPRAGFSFLVATAAALVGRDALPFAWLAVTLAAQLATLAVTEPMRRDPDFKVTRRREIAFEVGLGLSAVIYASCGALFWFGGGAGGRIFAITTLASGVVNVGLQAQGSLRRLWIGSAPFLLLLQGLPLISLVRSSGAEREVLGLTSFAATLMVLHLIAAGRRSVENAVEVRAALAVARRERERAEAASAAKSDFLGVMSHELRTPLNGVLGMAQAMEADQLTPAQHARVEVIRQSGESLLVLLNDLLDISEIDTARLEIEAGSVDLAELAVRAEAVFAPLALAKDLSFNVHLLGSAGVARRGDPVRVRQVLHNLVGNAVKFTEAGHVSVVISGSPDELVFEVCDTGPGVTREDARDLFKSFSLRDASTTRRHGGSGLGLAIARGLAELMDGEVTVRSTPGEGSVFTARLRLPQADAAPAAEAAPAPLDTPAAPRLRVLAAEDNPTNQLVLRTLLEQVGVDVHIVADGEAALAAWRAAVWDLVLMDIQMPKMDGVAAARAIRAWEAVERRARTPIVAVTANGSAEETAEYMAVGMDGVAPKPIQLGQLVAVIADVTSQAGAPPGVASKSGRSAA